MLDTDTSQESGERSNIFRLGDKDLILTRYQYIPWARRGQKITHRDVRSRHDLCDSCQRCIEAF